MQNAPLKARRFIYNIRSKTSLEGKLKAYTTPGVNISAIEEFDIRVNIEADSDWRAFELIIKTQNTINTK